MFFLFQLASLKDKDLLNINKILVKDELKAANTYVEQQTGKKNYFKEGTNWGDIRKGFKELKLDFNSFLQWYEKQRLEELNKAREGFTKPSSGRQAGQTILREAEKARQTRETGKAEEAGRDEFFEKRNS